MLANALKHNLLLDGWHVTSLATPSFGFFRDPRCLAGCALSSGNDEVERALSGDDPPQTWAGPSTLPSICLRIYIYIYNYYFFPLLV